MLSISQVFQNQIQYSVHKGDNLYFWQETSLGGRGRGSMGALKAKYPRLFELVSNVEAKVGECIIIQKKRVSESIEWGNGGAVWMLSYL